MDELALFLVIQRLEEQVIVEFVIEDRGRAGGGKHGCIREIFICFQ